MAYLKSFERSFNKYLALTEGGRESDFPSPSSNKKAVYGVTSEMLENFSFNGKLEDLDKETAMKISYELFWKPLRLDEIAPYGEQTAYEMYVAARNFGVDKAVSWFKILLNFLYPADKKSEQLEVKSEGSGQKSAKKSSSKSASKSESPEKESSKESGVDEMNDAVIERFNKFVESAPDQKRTVLQKSLAMMMSSRSIMLANKGSFDNDFVYKFIVNRL